MSKVVFITGAARRIGAVIAETLHAAGMNIVLHYNHSAAGAEHLFQLFNTARPHSAMLLSADLANVPDMQALLDPVLQKWGQLDVVINNASRFYATPLKEANRTQWTDLINSNLTAPYFLCQAAAPYLQHQQGSIINIADIHGERPLSDYSIYCISKAGLIMLTKALAKELGPDVRVNAIAPGAMIWPEGANTLAEQTQERILQKIVLGRAGSPSEIGKAVLFLINDASYMTGHTLVLDGGRMLSM